MSDHEARPRAVYDHSEDEPRLGRRRRQAADWGVGDELFDHMPSSRRFARRGADHQIPRGEAEDGRRTIVIEQDDPAPAAAEAPQADEAFASRDAALRARDTLEGRRTVKIVGRPGEHYPPSVRRRPPRTVHERLGPRPDRIAAWACALGLLLILIAILTQ